MQIGAQLWLFHALQDEDSMETVLTHLKAADYDCVETMYGKPPQNRSVLDRLDLKCYATHIALCTMPEGAELANFAHRMGAGTLCVSGLLRWQEREADDYRRSAEALNVWGRRLQSEGLALAYHNHDFEFAEVEGAATGMDLLLSGLDPKAVSLCFDAGWAARAGHDPVAFLLKHAAHIGTLHLRDFRGMESVPLGAGDLDLSSLLAALPHLPNLQALLVEQDPGTTTPTADMAASRSFLKERFGL
jgi:sugar phosphate isomerase/epimerase